MTLRWVDRELRLRSGPEFRARLDQLYASVRARHAAELTRAGFFRRIILHCRITAEWRKELDKELPEIRITVTQGSHGFLEHLLLSFPRLTVFLGLLWLFVGFGLLMLAEGVVRAIGFGLVASFIGFYFYIAYFSSLSRKWTREGKIAKLHWLREEGTISEEEFNKRMKGISGSE